MKLNPELIKAIEEILDKGKVARIAVRKDDIIVSIAESKIYKSVPKDK